MQGSPGTGGRPDGTAWTLPDNGFGSKATSPDAMPRFRHVLPDGRRGTPDRLQAVLLHGPDGVVPFDIVDATSPLRSLTGADFDIVSIEGLEIADADPVVVSNVDKPDVSPARSVDRDEDSEVVLLRMPEPMRAR